MYIRFITKGANINSGVQSGLFTAAYELARNDVLPEYTGQTLLELLDWFENNLLIPKRFNRTKSKGFYRRSNKGIAWFKPVAEQHISKAFELKAILEDQGYLIEILTSSRLGYVIYEDEHQIIAEPFRDTGA